MSPKGKHMLAASISEREHRSVASSLESKHILAIAFSLASEYLETTFEYKQKLPSVNPCHVTRA